MSRKFAIRAIFKRMFVLQHPLANFRRRLNDVFRSLFRYEHMKKKGQIQILTDLISGKIKEDFNPPECHRDKIIRRFVFNRMHFWASFINSNMKEINDKNISEASNSSKTAKRATAVPS